MPTSSLQNLIAPTIKVGGAPLDAALYDELLEVVVDQTINALTMVTLRFDDSRLELLDQETFALGKTLEIALAGSEASPVVLAKVEITAIEPEILAAGRSSLLVRGLHKGHRLHYNRQTKTWLNTKDSDVISATAQDLGISATVTATDVTYPHIFRWNQTGMEFVLERARRAGLVLLCDGDALKFISLADQQGAAASQLAFGAQIIRFAVRTSTGGYTGDTVFSSWDVKNKQAIVSNGPTPAAVRQLGDAKFQSNSTLGSVYAGTSHYVDRALEDPAAATKAATAWVNAMYEDLVDMELACIGDVRLKAGVKITVANVGARFSGAYLVTTVRHVLSDAGYICYVTASGWDARTFAELVGADAGRRRMEGVAVAVVTANDESAANDGQQGRVKVKFPHYSNEDESWWVRLASPMAGASRGLYILPEVNDEVLVAFEEGDPNRPVVIGTLWNGRDAPPLASNTAVLNGKVEKRILKTRAGNLIEFNDEAGSEQVTIADKAGNKVVLFAKGGEEKITITAIKDMEINVANGLLSISAKNYSLTASEKITQKSSQGSTYEATQDLVLKSSANLKATATQNMELSATASFKISGTGGVEVASNANMKLSANANLELSAMAQFKASGAAMAEVSGGGMLKLGGALINIG